MVSGSREIAAYFIMEKIKYILLGLCLGLVIVVITNISSCGHRQEKKVITIHDTIIHTDTIIQYKPKPYRVTVLDTIYIPQYPQNPQYPQDTLIRKEITYKDSSYTAVVEGINPSLKYIEVYQKTNTITNTITINQRSRWALGIQAGYGAGRNGLQPYIGLGVQYNILQW